MDFIKTLINNSFYLNYLYLFSGIILSLFGFWLTRKLLRTLIIKLVSKSKTNWDDLLLESSVFDRLSYLVPVIIINPFIQFIPGPQNIFSRIIICLIMLIIILSSGALITGFNQIYKTMKISQSHPIKSYLQIVKLIVYVLGGIVIIAVLLGQSPMVLISGLGAMTAVLMLIFRDTILAFVASLQITSNDLLKVGDWVEAPAFKADGDVMDIALHTVKVQNWDKTITIIPTHKLVDNSFKNWRGMSQSGGRRIKRSIFIDMTTVRFCTPNEIEKYKNFEVLSKYIKTKQTELTEFNTSRKSNLDELVNGRRMTNLGTFRAYILTYLQNHPDIHQDMTLLVRQLAPDTNGIPLELYCFTNDTRWNVYEDIQANIFDHILAIVTEFGLKVFQDPGGADFQALK